MLTPRLSRVGDHPALDLLNSVVVARGKPTDRIGDGQMLQAWLSETMVLPTRGDADFSGWTPADFELLARNTRALREDLRKFLLLRLQSPGYDDAKQDVSFFNDPMANTGFVHVLVVGDDRWELQARPEACSPAVVLGELALACADLIANCAPFQVRRCANPGCTMWFYSNRRGPPRRWCSMTVCGNRMKAMAHRRLVRSAGASPGSGAPKRSPDPREHGITLAEDPP